mgnify:CR=1 FL=1
MIGFVNLPGIRSTRRVALVAVFATLAGCSIFTPQQQEAVDAITRSIVAKIAHQHIVELRNDAAQSEGGEMVNAIRRIFNLGDS